MIDELKSTILPALRKHDYIAKEQARHLQNLKSSLTPSEVLVIGDFSENFSFVVQDAVQEFHWTKNQATIHPWVAYYKNEKNELQHLSVLMISDYLTHDINSISTFQKHLIKILKLNLPEIQKIYYFSDGAASQYKNKKNLLNTAYHKEDYGIEAEWHYFATSHGKGPCDGVGGTFKRYATKASLQRPANNHILNTQDLFSWSQTLETKIIPVLVLQEEIKKTEEFLNERFNGLQTVNGTRSFHSILPISKDIIRVRKVSTSQTYTDVKFKFKIA